MDKVATLRDIQGELFLYKHRKEITKIMKKFSDGGHYSILPILETGATYNVIIGEKSNGKSTAVQMLAVIIKWLYNAETVLLRTYDEDFKQGRAAGMFNGLPAGFIEYVTKGKYNAVVYKSTRWYLAKRDEDDKITTQETPMAHRMHILNCGSSYQYPNVKLILFDEFISKGGDYPTIWEDFQTVLSTIIRLQKTPQIFMCGNTINAHSVFFKEMGLKNVKTQKQGTIDVYQAGDLCLIACEYCGNAKAKTNNNIYWPFKNATSKMITSGAWQLDFYPKPPVEIKPADIVEHFFIKFEEITYMCKIVATDSLLFIFIHEKTTPIKGNEENEKLIFQLEDDPRPNYINNILKPTTRMHRRIYELFATNKVYYQSNPVGDNIRAFIKLSSQK